MLKNGRFFLLLFFAVCAAVTASAQPNPLVTDPTDRFVATANTTALTIQQPATGARRLIFGDTVVAGASVYCAAAQTATISWNGTAATATAGTELPLPGTKQPSGATVWTGSNVGGGTTGPVFNVPAGGTLNIALTWFNLGLNGTANNLTITTSGSCTITFAYTAQRP